MWVLLFPPLGLTSAKKWGREPWKTLLCKNANVGGSLVEGYPFQMENRNQWKQACLRLPCGRIKKKISFRGKVLWLQGHFPQGLYRLEGQCGIWLHLTNTAKRSTTSA